MAEEFLSGEYLLGEVTDIRETSFPNDRTKQIDHYKDIYLLIDHEDRTRTSERVRAPFTFDTSTLVIGMSYGLPVSTRLPYKKRDGSLSALSRSLRTALPIMPAPARPRPQT